MNALKRAAIASVSLASAGGDTFLADSGGVTTVQAQTMSSFATYLIGFIILIIGLAFAAYLLNVPTTWIAVGVIVLVGIGILSATSRTKMRDPGAPGGTSTTIVERRPPTGPNA